MIRRRFAAFTLAASLFSASAMAQQDAAPALPDIDSRAYCARVAKTVGGSRQIELSCVQQERRAAAALAAQPVEASILAYCVRVASSVSSGYAIIESCVRMEQRAAAELDAQ